MALTVRGKNQRWLSSHRGITEQPAGSNRDSRQDGITAAQKRLGAWLVGLPWCGVWAGNALLAAGVKGVTYRLASVALIEEDARAGRAPFAAWVPPGGYKQVLRGDLVVLFGRGVHVGTVRSFRKINGQVYVVTEEGNTSSGVAGSQSNGGGSYKRVRPLSDVYGFARVDYGTPGPGATRATRALMALDRSKPDPAQNRVLAPSSDLALSRALESQDAPERTPEMLALRAGVRGARLGGTPS